MAALDRLERLTDLVLVLLNSPGPRTLDEIAHVVPGYPEGHEARRQAFERDKRVLREEGIPLLTEAVTGPEQFGYRIDPADFYLRDLDLEPDEQAALHLAVAGVHLGDPSGRDALAKLGALGIAEARPVAALVPPPALVPLFDALRTHAEVTFDYRGARRVVAPAAVSYRAGRWYLTGWDLGREAGRTFRVDRVEGVPAVGAPGSGALPDSFAVDDVPEPWRVPSGGSDASARSAGTGSGDDAEDELIHLLVDTVEAPRVGEEVGDRAIEERRGDGSILLRLGVTSADAMRSWVLGLLDHAEVVGPPAQRDAIVQWLERTAAGVLVGGDAAQDGDAGDLAANDDRDSAAVVTGGADADGVATDEGQRETVASGPSPRRPLPANARLRRLLAMVGWLAQVGEATIPDIAARFDIGENEVVRELELAACCGLPPYSPDVLLEIVVTEETVQAFLPAEPPRPRRLTPAEGLAVAAAARTILAVPGADQDGALARALTKLDAILGDPGRFRVQLDAPSLLGDVEQLLRSGTQAEIEYHSASTDETTTRVIEPLELVTAEGHWYLDAYCHRAEGLRRFRVDRIRELRPLDALVSPDRAGAAARPRTAVFVPGPGSEAVRIRLAPEARWVVDTVPVLDAVNRSDGTAEVTLAVGGRAWLERLLLQLGPHAQVLAPPDLTGVASEAAKRVLQRYS